MPLSPPKENRFFQSPRTTKATIFAHATVTDSDIAPTYLNTEYSDHSVTDLMTTLETKPRRKATTTTKAPTTTTTTTTTTSINWTRNGKIDIITAMHLKTYIFEVKITGVYFAKTRKIKFKMGHIHILSGAHHLSIAIREKDTKFNVNQATISTVKL